MREGEQHLTAEQGHALLRGELEPQMVVNRLFRHLLALCPECKEGWQELQAQGQRGDRETPPATQQELEDQLTKIFEGLRSRVKGLRQRITRERDQAEGLLQELRQLPDLPARVTRVRRSKRFRSWALCEGLLAESLRLSLERPVEAGELAELAVETAWALDDSSLGRPLIGDLMARGWAARGHARRRGGQPELAQEAFVMSWYFVEQGSGDPLVSAEIMSLEALLQRDKGEMSRALRLQNRAVHIYQELEATQQLAKALLHRSATFNSVGDPAAALSDLRQCIGLLERRAGDLPDDPRLRRCAEHALIFTLQRAGHLEEARERLATLAAEEPQPADPWGRLSESWLKEELARTQGDPAEAEFALLEVQASLVEGGVYHPKALPDRSMLALLVDSQKAGTEPEKK